MYITLVGYIILPLGVLLFFLPGDVLLATTIALSGFTGTSVFVLKGVSVQPCYYLAFLWIIQHLIRTKFNLSPSGYFYLVAYLFMYCSCFTDDAVTSGGESDDYEC